MHRASPKDLIAELAGGGGVPEEPGTPPTLASSAELEDPPGIVLPPPPEGARALASWGSGELRPDPAVQWLPGSPGPRLSAPALSDGVGAWEPRSAGSARGAFPPEAGANLLDAPGFARSFSGSQSGPLSILAEASRRPADACPRSPFEDIFAPRSGVSTRTQSLDAAGVCVLPSAWERLSDQDAGPEGALECPSGYPASQLAGGPLLRARGDSQGALRQSSPLLSPTRSPRVPGPHPPPLLEGGDGRKPWPPGKSSAGPLQGATRHLSLQTSQQTSLCGSQSADSGLLPSEPGDAQGDTQDCGGAGLERPGGAALGGALSGLERDPISGSLPAGGLLAAFPAFFPPVQPRVAQGASLVPGYYSDLDRPIARLLGSDPEGSGLSRNRRTGREAGLYPWAQARQLPHHFGSGWEMAWGDRWAALHSGLSDGGDSGINRGVSGGDVGAARSLLDGTGHPVFRAAEAPSLDAQSRQASEAARPAPLGARKFPSSGDLLSTGGKYGFADSPVLSPVSPAGIAQAGPRPGVCPGGQATSQQGANQGARPGIRPTPSASFAPQPQAHTQARLQPPSPTKWTWRGEPAGAGDTHGAAGAAGAAGSSQPLNPSSVANSANLAALSNPTPQPGPKADQPSCPGQPKQAGAFKLSARPVPLFTAEPPSSPRRPSQKPPAHSGGWKTNPPPAHGRLRATSSDLDLSPVLSASSRGVKASPRSPAAADRPAERPMRPARPADCFSDSSPRLQPSDSRELRGEARGETRGETRQPQSVLPSNAPAAPASAAGPTNRESSVLSSDTESRLSGISPVAQIAPRLREAARRHKASRPAFSPEHVTVITSRPGSSYSSSIQIFKLNSNPFTDAPAGE